MVQNILGNGIDIPLLGLREASREVEGEYHELFNDESYKIAQCFMLSTSQVTTLTISVANCTMIIIALNVSSTKNCTIKFIQAQLAHLLYCTSSFNCNKKFIFRRNQETKQGVRREHVCTSRFLIFL